MFDSIIKWFDSDNNLLIAFAIIAIIGIYYM